MRVLKALHHLRKYMDILEMTLLYFGKVMRLLLVMQERIVLRVELVMILLMVEQEVIQQFSGIHMNLIL